MLTESHCTFWGARKIPTFILVNFLLALIAALTWAASLEWQNISTEHVFCNCLLNSCHFVSFIYLIFVLWHPRALKCKVYIWNFCHFLVKSEFSCIQNNYQPYRIYAICSWAACVSVGLIVESTRAASEVRKAYPVNRVPLLSSAERVKCLQKTVCAARKRWWKWHKMLRNETPGSFFNCPSQQLGFIFCQLVTRWKPAAQAVSLALSLVWHRAEKP